jgi:hypothetical protein
MSIIEEGQLRGAFKGFHNRETVFEFHGGGIWRQNEYRYQYQYAYMPNARVVDEGGRYMLYVDGMDEPVEVKRVR